MTQTIRQRERMKAWRVAYPEKIHDANREWKASHMKRHLANCKTWRDRHPEKNRNHQYLRLYGISLEDYDKILTQQEGVCACCGKPDFIRLHVDHDHKTGKVRGLLCHICNQKVLPTLEIYGDRLQLGIEYLARTA
jgi:hypothetical protein